MTRTRRFCWLCLLWIIAGLPLLAHGMKITLRVDAQGAVVGSASYGAHPVVNAQVRFLAPDGVALGEVTSDAQGAFTFPVKERCTLRVVITEGSHRGEKVLPESTFPSSLPLRGGGGASAPARTVDTSALSSVVEAAVARRLESVEVLLQKQADANRLRDVLGGIGYILGLAGVGFYVAGRAKAGR